MLVRYRTYYCVVMCMNEKDRIVSEDAVVIGGSGESARRCISAASCNIKLEIVPEVRQLCDALEKNDEPAHKNSPKKKIDSAAIDESDASAEGSAKVSKGSDSPGETKKPRRIKKWIVAAASLLLAVIAAFGIYEAYRINTIVNSVNYSVGNLSFENIDLLVSESETESFVSHTDETKNILLCGCDIDKNGISRTDSIIILSIDHTHRKIKMTSLMRDMYLKIPGQGKNKINAAYTFGGGELLLKTIYSNFGMKIDKYVCVDYGVFAAIVDDLDGVEIEIEEMELEQFNKYVRGGKKNRITEAGRYNFNGQQALSYCRIRKVGSDTARTARQRKVMREIIRKCRKLSPLEAQRIFAVIAPCITTNMTRDDMASLLMEGLDSLNYDTAGLRIPMDGAWKDKKIGNLLYVDVDLNRNARYINSFIYGDDEISQALVEQQQKKDDQNAEYNRLYFEKNKKKKKQ